MSDRRATHVALPLIEALLDGTIDDTGFARLEALLRDDAEARSLYRSLANLHAALPAIIGRAPRVSVQLTDNTGDMLFESDQMPNDQFLKLMMQVEVNGEDLDPMVLAAERFPAPEPDVLTKQDWANAGRYLLSQVKHYRQQMIMGAAAAVMLLAAVLFLTWGGPDQSIPLAGNDPTNETPSADTQRTPLVAVATLTAAHDARWESDIDFGTPELGETLFSEQRLVLTQGFAEITTKRGAVVLVQAPATIGLLDSDNAVYLHEGNLVGSCRTQRSKGFVVHTKHADVVDLGTEFGVEVSADGMVATVFSGKVEVTPVGGVAEPVVANQTARLMVRGNARDLQVESRVVEGFTRLLPRPALVTSATINDDRFKVEVVPQGVVEDAKLFTDREHEINGLDDAGIPAILLGGDIIRTPADARPDFNENTEDMAITIELAAPADVYLLFGEPNQVPPAWIEAQYEPTDLQVGMDFGSLPKLGEQPTLGVGPGVSIDKAVQVWKRKQVAKGRVIVGGPLQNNFTYSLIAVPKPQPD